MLGRDLERGFEVMVRTHQDQIFAFALGMTGSWAEADDVAQEAFVRAYRALTTYPPVRRRELKARPWLHQIALNAFRNRIRRRTPRLVPIEEGLQVPDSRDGGPEEAAMVGESRQRLLAALRMLPDHQREAVVMRVVKEVPYAEASEVLGRPVGTLKSDVHRRLAALRGLLLQEVSA